MELGEYISIYRKEAGLTIDELASLSGVPKGTINKIIAGTTKSPTLETVQCLAGALGKSINDFTENPNKEEFSTSEKDHIQKYRLLDGYGKEAVDGILDVEWRRCEEVRTAALREDRMQMEAAEETVPDDSYSMPMYSLPMSAGTGQQAGEEYPDDFLLKKRPPRGTSFIARVSGNSMEPDYREGDLVFVHATVEIRIGQIGAFFMDGQLWIKELGEGELISHNPEYKPRPMTDDVRCQGLVLGVCDESYFE